jgi:hypothetical protein
MSAPDPTDKAGENQKYKYDTHTFAKSLDSPDINDACNQSAENRPDLKKQTIERDA